MGAETEAYRIEAELYYRATGDEIALFEAAYHDRLPVMLKGPTGCGKTRFIEHMAWRHGRPLVTVAAHEDKTAADLAGRYLLAPEGAVWRDGPLTLAVRGGAGDPRGYRRTVSQSARARARARRRRLDPHADPYRPAGRPACAGGLAPALARHDRAPIEEVEAWAEAVLRLAYVNAGPGTLLGVFRLAALTPPCAGVLRRLAAEVAAAAELCGAAGAGATRAAIEARITLAERFGRGDPEAGWWRGLLTLAREAPELVAAAVEASAAILEACGFEGFETSVGAALRAAPERERRAAFLSLAYPEARRTLDRLAGRAAFSAEQKRLEMFSTALWSVAALLPLLDAPGAPPPRRASVAGGVARIPEIYPERRARPGPVPRRCRACDGASRLWQPAP